MKQIKRNDAISCTIHGINVTGVAVIINGFYCIGHNSRKLGGTYAKSYLPSGYKYLRDLTGSSNIKIGDTPGFIDEVAGYIVDYSEDRLVFGCGEVDIQKNDLKAWVKSKLAGDSHGADDMIKSAMGNNGIDELSLEECQRVDYMVHKKSTKFADDLYKAINTKYIPDFKHGDYFTGQVYGGTISGRVNKLKANSPVVLCFNNSDYDYDRLTLGKDTFGYPFSAEVEDLQSNYKLELLTKVTEKDVETPDFYLNIGGDQFVIQSSTKNIIFGCGEVSYTKKAILNWLNFSNKQSKEVSDFLMIERELAERGANFCDFTSDEMQMLEELCKK